MCVRVLIYMYIRSKPVMESTSISTWIQTGSTIDIQYVVIPKKRDASKCLKYVQHGQDNVRFSPEQTHPERSATAVPPALGGFTAGIRSFSREPLKLFSSGEVETSHHGISWHQVMLKRAQVCIYSSMQIHIYNCICIYRYVCVMYI